MQTWWDFPMEPTPRFLTNWQSNLPVEIPFSKREKMEEEKRRSWIRLYMHIGTAERRLGTSDEMTIMAFTENLLRNSKAYTHTHFPLSLSKLAGTSWNES